MQVVAFLVAITGLSFPLKAVYLLGNFMGVKYTQNANLEQNNWICSKILTLKREDPSRATGIHHIIVLDLVENISWSSLA